MNKTTKALFVKKLSKIELAKLNYKNGKRIGRTERDAEILKVLEGLLKRMCYAEAIEELRKQLSEANKC